MYWTLFVEGSVLVCVQEEYTFFFENVEICAARM
jgi:hypothetical protein